MADKRGRLTLAEAQALTVSEVLAMPEADLRKVAGTLRDVANKRYKRLKSSTRAHDTRAEIRLENAARGESPLIKIKGLTGDDLRRETLRALNFIQGKSTLRESVASRKSLEEAVFGISTEERVKGRSLAERELIVADAEVRAKRMFELYRRYEDEHAGEQLDSDFILSLAGQWAEMERRDEAAFPEWADDFDKYVAFDAYIDERFKDLDRETAVGVDYEWGTDKARQGTADEMLEWLDSEGYFDF